MTVSLYGGRVDIQHTQETLLGVFQLKVLVWELGTIDGLSASTITTSEVSALNHELLDDSVERRSFVAEALFAGCKSSEVLRSLGDGLAIETHDNPAKFFISMRDVEVDLVGNLRTLCCFRSLGEEDESKSDNEHQRDDDLLETCHRDCEILLASNIGW